MGNIIANLPLIAKAGVIMLTIMPTLFYPEFLALYSYYSEIIVKIVVVKMLEMIIYYIQQITTLLE